jgi:hypothetical protein
LGPEREKRKKMAIEKQQEVVPLLRADRYPETKW